MNYKMMGKFLSQILMVEIVFMIPALLISIFDGEYPAVTGFVVTILITAVISLVLYVLCRNSKNRFFAREGFVCVGISWIAISFFGCLPFWISREIPHFVDALFEMASGYTTTGASILSNVEAMSRGLLYWRSFSHWLGGMGVLVFLLALAPNRESGSGFTMHLLRAESPGPNVGKLVPKMRTTARILYLIYILLTILDLMFLLLGGMSLFDAVCTAFGTAGTGGFGIKNDSMAGYSPYIQNVCTVFMFLFGINFSCFYLLLIKQVKAVWKDEELRLYCTIVFTGILLVIWNLKDYYATIGETIRHAAFQVVSVVTTTGFATTDFDLWPNFSKMLLLFLMFTGACAGSTAGGLKVGRVLLLFKNLRRNIRRLLNPRRVETVRVNGVRTAEEVLRNTNTYLVAYALIMVISILLVSVDELSISTDISAVVSCFNNIGPGLDMVGPTANYSVFSDFSKLVLIFDMLAGRLEIFPILILFSRSTWRRK
ncbi:MAG: TrkH family potassium uptake protein [Lachnospiraceae bacterium]|nr:TrkH family potassium uptake protein [Agathobacter sp.]MDD6444414.1 TrkH family potassium uptake protein [Lachnospiraceae bacterium]MDY4892743.1 TrkH family potassium uptake protein [Agathobacter sp.]